MLLKDKTVVIFGGSGAIGRAAALAQIAGVITFLASPPAAAMTATVVNVTAGATLS